MRDIYITKDGYLRKKDNSIELRTEDNIYNIPINATENIYVLSSITLTSKLLEYLSKMGICVHFNGYYGNYFGSYYPKENNPSGNVLIQQVLSYRSFPSRLNIAKEICIASCHNMRKTLMQHSLEVIFLENKIERMKSASKIQDLMLLEANSRKYYYSKFDLIIKKEDYRFMKRSKQPPLNKINAMLSFGNSLLYSTILSEIYKTPLDPRISFLHEPFTRRFSLNLDFADVFKPLIVDRVIFSLINRNELSEEDFTKESSGCFFSKSGRKKFIYAYDTKLNQTLKHPRLKRKASYWELIRLDLYSLVKNLIEDEKFNCFKIYW